MNTTLSPAMDETLRYIYSEVIERYTPEYIKTIEFEYTPWVFSLLGSFVIGLSGILPLVIIPLDAGGNGGSQFNDRKYKFTYFFVPISATIFSCCFFFSTIT